MNKLDTVTKTGNPQAGFALVTVLLVASLVAIIASQMIYQQTIDIQRSQNQLNQAQALAVANGLSDWVKKGLELDLQNNKVDHLSEQWNSPLIAVPFAGGQVSGNLIDLQGRFNLNNLLEPNTTKRELWVKVLTRLLNQKQLGPELIAVIGDWIDADDDSRFEGAESDLYQLKQPAYRASNQALVLSEELSLLEGFTEENREKLQGLVSTLPIVTKININTAPVEILASLADWMSIEIANSWLDSRKKEPAKTIAEFRTAMILASDLTAAEINIDLTDDIISVQTQFFRLEGQVEYGVANQNVLAILFRKDKGSVQIIQRWIGVIDDE